MPRARSNPYHEASRAELSRAIERVLQELEPRGPRTPAEREALAIEVRDLLLVLFREVAPEPYASGKPDHSIAGGQDPVDAWAAWYDAEAKIARVRAISRAAEAVRGPGARNWLTSGPTPTPAQHAVASEEGLRAALARLREGAPRRPASRG